MRTVTFQSALFGVASLAFGTSDDLNTQDAAAITRFLNKEVRTALEEYPWPDWTLVEERAYRLAWTAGSYASGAEVYHLGAYWRASSAAVAGDIPGTAALWAAPTDLDKYVAYEQTAKTYFGEILGVWDNNPRVTESALEHTFSLSSNGVQVIDGGTTVWVEFRRRIPVFTSTLHVQASTYALGALVYSTTAGECYEAIATVPGSTVITNTTYWRKVDFPYSISSYAIQAAYAEWLKSEGEHEKVRSQRAEAELLLSRAIQQHPITQRQSASYAVR